MGEYIEKVRETTASIATGASAVFDSIQDEQGNGIPKSMNIQAILVSPSASTRFKLQLFAKDTKISDASDATYSMIYEKDYEAVNTSAMIQVRDEIAYIDEDVAANILYGEIHGRITNHASGAESTFVIDILY